MINSHMLFLLFLTLIAFCKAAPQYLIHLDSHLAYPHPAVLANSAMEDTLPDELKNQIYKNSHVADRLARASWFGYKETQVCFKILNKMNYY